MYFGFAQHYKQKGFTLILILVGIVIIASVAGGAYYFGKSQMSKPQPPNPMVTSQTPQPTPSPTNEIVNWKTYTNKKLSFRYPPDWEVSSPEFFGPRIVVEFKYKQTPLFTLTEVDNYKQDTKKPYISLNEFIGSSRIDKTKDIMISGNPAKQVIDPGEQGHSLPSEEILLFTPDKSSIISLHYSKDYYDQPDSDKMLDQISATFKFLDQANTEGQFCGGIVGTPCPSGFNCKLDGNFPDAGGKCVKE